MPDQRSRCPRHEVPGETVQHFGARGFSDWPYTPAPALSTEDGCGVGRVWVLAVAAAA
jgi:hypothetical protein